MSRYMAMLRRFPLTPEVPRATVPRSALLALATVLCPVAFSLACSTAGPTPSTAPDAQPSTVLEAHRGEIEDVLLMSGELEASSAIRFGVPRTDMWVLTIRQLVEDGALVEEGQSVVEFDNTAFLKRKLERTIELDTEQFERARAAAAGAADEADKLFDVRRAETTVAKAELDAAVARDTISPKSYEERQLALRRARENLEKAREELETFRHALAMELKVKDISLGKAKRELANTEQALLELVVKAPRAGLFVAEQNWREGRQYQVGDTAHPGQVVASLPDLGKMRVRAKMTDVDEGTVTVGMMARCRLDAYPDQIYLGRIGSVSPVARQRGGESLQQFFVVLVELEQTDVDKMRPGMSVRVEAVRRRVEDVLTVPRDALDLDSEKTTIRLADGQVRNVTVDFCNQVACVLKGGVEPGTRLLPMWAVSRGKP